jgi:cytochrome-b5 reductase
MNIINKFIVPQKFAGIAAALTGGAVAYYSMNSRGVVAESSSSPPPKALGSGLNFISLRLHSSESISPTTKRLRFELSDPKAVSGLNLVSALLMVARPEGRWLPVLRPYTPTGDLGKSTCSCCALLRWGTTTKTSTDFSIR